MNKKEKLKFTMNLMFLLGCVGLGAAMYGMIYPKTTTLWFWFGFSGVCFLGAIVDYTDYRKIKK
ncbi:hypothetical protein J2W98_003828 [Paenibacillus peoriae]|uniref:Lipoprotein n=1 Tax=Paenibacillus peoriae TaxID=59893 RepID=A0ABU1QIS0_9BACL|nr:hypothetical protein [Paenibacillus peoriae]MDR6779548.1 hypothetical protein [Paenibacillus peoriae]